MNILNSIKAIIISAVVSAIYIFHTSSTAFQKGVAIVGEGASRLEAFIKTSEVVEGFWSHLFEAWGTIFGLTLVSCFLLLITISTKTPNVSFSRPLMRRLNETLGGETRMKQLFRIAVVASFLLYAVWYFLPYLEHLYLDQTGLELRAWDGYGAILPTGSISYMALFMAWLVISVGLFFFQSWARVAFLVLHLIHVIASPFWGITVTTGVDNAFSYVVSLLDGAIIVMSYLTSVSDRFRPPNKSFQPTANASAE